MSQNKSQTLKHAGLQLSDYLMESIESFSILMQIPVTFVDAAGNIRLEWGNDSKICSFADQYGVPASDCGRNLLSSIDYASKLGEPYIFVCRGGLVKIAVALYISGKLIGGFLAGPIVMGALRESNITKLIKEDSISTSDFPKLNFALNKIKVYSPKEVSYISLMLNNCILSSVDNASDYFLKSERYEKQSRLSSEVRNYKKIHKDMSYPQELEDQVSQLVRSGDSKGTSEAASGLLDELYLLEAGDLNAVKMRVYSLFNLLLRGLPDWDQFPLEYIETESGDLEFLTDQMDYEGMKHQACSILGNLAMRYADSFYHGSSKIVEGTVKYINKNFKEKLTLRDSADHFHVNQSYLSALFKQEMGKSFTEYLTMLRLQEAKKLLRKTNLNLTNIAYQCGFEDQSYFSKVFRKVEGITPSQYRNQRRTSS
ncbi:MAG: AraC family transcriptional regulator [Clostridiales bacterium]|nr:AraC family transcriptional regulator [Clostridiales bacterium]